MTDELSEVNNNIPVNTSKANRSSSVGNELRVID
jgi:hypothetical protein